MPSVSASAPISRSWGSGDSAGAPSSGLGVGIGSGAEVGVSPAGATVLGLLGVADVSRLGGIRVAWPDVVAGVSVED